MALPGPGRCIVAGLAVALAGLVLALAGCASPAHHPAIGATGSVHGAIVQVGGPAGVGPGHPPGAVTVTRAGHRVAEQKVAEGTEFRFTLSPGTYRLAVKGVDGGCAPADATVTNGSDQAIELTCQRK